MEIKNTRQDLTIATFSSVLLKVYQLASETSPEKFQQGVLDLLRGVLHIDSATWGLGLMGADGVIIHSVYTYRQPPDMMESYERIKHLDVVAMDAFSSMGQTINFASTAPQWQTRCDPELMSHVKRFNFSHTLATVVSDMSTRLLFAIWLSRADPESPYTEEERLFQQGLVPHLAETWKINRLNFLQNKGSHEGYQRAIAICDKRGWLYEIGPRFSALLHLEWPHWTGNLLPNDVVERLSEETWRWQSGQTITLTCEPLNDMRLITVRKKVGLGALSRREFEIAKYFGKGVGHREISDALFIAPKTVRNHIQTIYEKLDVSSRIELSLLMSEPEE
jgi:DNA-binding CsgD family transcriptional regulator